MLHAEKIIEIGQCFTELLKSKNGFVFLRHLYTTATNNASRPSSYSYSDEWWVTDWPYNDDREIEKVPAAAQVRVRMKHEAISDDLDDRLECKNY